VATAIAYTFALALMAATSAWAVDNDGIFELDGNAVESAAAGDDWSTVNGAGGEEFQQTGVIDDSSAADDIFSGGGSKDGNDVTQWKRATRGTPDKDDITNAYAAAYVPDSGPRAGHLVVYFGADRFDNSGDAQIGFWFFQKSVGPSANGRAFTGSHTLGDLLVLSNFVNGGATSNIAVYEWVGSGGSDGAINLLTTATSSGNAVCNPASGSIPADAACAITNPADGATAPWPYLSKDGTSTFPKVTFFEGGIDLTAIGHGGECISTFIAETRSSQSASAVLKDVALGSFNTCGISITKSCTANINTAGTGVTVNVTGQVCNIGPGQVTNLAITDSTGATLTPTSTTIGAKGQANECVSYSGSYPSASLANSDTATATVSASGTSVSASATASCSAAPGKSITISKSCDASTLVNTGGVVAVQINFSGTLQNTGDVQLSGVAVTDNPAATISVTKTTLAPGESTSYSGSYLPSSTTELDPTSATFSDQTTVQATGALGTGGVQVTSSPATCGVCQ